jgi:probable rRNA maturation factor
LSFEAADPSTVGELVLCLPTIRAQAKRTGLGERGELGYMLVHGVLHLLGYDHADAQGEAEMFALQDALYAKLEASVGLR